jgi:hypothetical protein
MNMRPEFRLFFFSADSTGRHDHKLRRHPRRRLRR